MSTPSDTLVVAILGGVSLMGMGILGWFGSTPQFYNPFKVKGSFLDSKDFLYVLGFVLFVLLPILFFQ